MALGAVYIRPQPLLLPATDTVTPVDVIMAFAEGILKDPEAAAPALAIMGEEATHALRDFFAGLEEKLRFADGKFRNVFQPFVGPVQTFVNGLGADALSTIPAVLESLAHLLDQFTADRVVALFRSLFDIFQKDLGVSETTLKNLMADVFSRMIERLQSRVTSGDTSKEAVALYDFGSGLDDIRLLLEHDVQIPSIDAEVILGFIGKLWQESGVDGLIAVIRQILDRGNQILDPVTKILHAVAEVNVSVSVGTPNRFMAANGAPAEPSTGDSNAQTAWYASWIAGQEVRFDEVNLGPTPGTGPLPPADAPTLFDNDFLRGITYASFKKETMEGAAYHTAWIFPLVEAVLLHGFSAESGDILNNLNAIIFDIVEFGLIVHEVQPGGFKRRPLPWWVKGFIWPASSFLLRALETLPRFFSDSLAISLILADMGENLVYRRWTWLARELTLSIMTLANHDAQELAAIRARTTDAAKLALVEKYKNVMFFDGVCLAAGEFGMMLLPLIFSRSNRGNYGLANQLLAPQIAYALLPGFFIPVSFNALAYLLVRLLTKEPVFAGDAIGRFFRAVFYERMFRNYSASGNFLEATGNVATSVLSVLAGAAMYPLNYMLYLHMFTDSHTDGGKLAIDQTGNSAPQNFQGYPSAAASPYLLPFGGNQETCVQGNLGIFSHNPQTAGQIYAFDFALDQGVEVLCSRAGMVISIDDTVPTGQKTNWNYVEIMHVVLNAPQGNAPLPLPTPAVPPLPAGLTLPANFVIAGPGVPTSNLALTAAGVLVIQTGPGGPTQIIWGTPPTVVPPNTQVFLPIPTVTVAGIPTPKPVFQDGATVIPPGTLFPPYWDNAGNLLVDFMPPLHPSLAILPAGAPALPVYYQNFTAPFTAATKIAFLISGQDDVGLGATPGQQPIVPGSVLINGLNSNGTTRIAATFKVYGHGIQNFMTQTVPAPPGANKPLYRTGSATLPAAGTKGAWSNATNYQIGDVVTSGGSTFVALTANTNQQPGTPAGLNKWAQITDFRNLVLGQFVQQGQVIMLADNTGFSFLNHVHVHVSGQPTLLTPTGTGGGAKWSIPFVYQDVGHNVSNGFFKAIFYGSGSARIFTSYSSNNTRVPPG